MTRDERRASTNKWIVLVLVCLAQFMVVLDATVVNVALPSIQRDLDLGPEGLQWIVNAYTLVFGGFLLLGGRAADVFGRRKIFVTGVFVFTLASLLNGLANSSEMLIASRALQGLGGALVSPAALSIIIATFPEGAERTKALAIWSAIAAGGAAAGLLMGGALTEALSWPWIFFVNVPVGIVAAMLTFRFVPESRDEGATRLDLAGAVTVTGGLVLLVFAIVKAQDYGWASTRTIGMAAVALAILAVFVVIERRVREPLVDLGIFKIRTVLTANLVLLGVASGMFAMFFLLSLYIQNVLGYGALKTGLAFLPVTVGIGIGAGIAQSIVQKFGVKAVSIGGILTAVSGLLWMTQLPVDGNYLTDLLPAFVLTSLGMGLTFVPITLLATGGVDESEAGLASGLYNTSQQVGGSLGVAILATLFADKAASSIENLGHAPSPADQMAAMVDGFQLAFAGGALMMFSGAVLLVTMIRKEHTDRINLEEAVAVPA